MTEINCKQKTGFNVLSNPVVILDNDMLGFYSTDLVATDKFNLPPGKYYLNTGEIQKRIFPVVYSIPILPFGERFFYPNPKFFEIVWGNNPNKCSVLWDDKKILFDNSIKQLPKFLRCYIYYHELGHYYYSTEKYCDLFASNCMLRSGFNPSQILLAQNFGLSDESHNVERKEFLKNIMFQTNSKPV